MKPIWVRGITAAMLLVGTVSTTLAADRPSAAPESLLSPESVLFLRYHGMAKCQSAYDQTAWAEVMHGELGQFIDHAIAIAVRAAENEMGKAGNDNPETARLKAFLPHVRPLLKQLEQQGFLIGVEVKGVEPPQASLMLVLPKANNPNTQAGIDALMKLVSVSGNLKIQASTVRGRQVSSFTGEMPMHIAWWMEGEHFVLHVGTDKPDAAIARIEGAKGETASLMGNPLYRQINSFKAYTKCADGFVDVQRCLTMLQKAVPPSTPFIDQLGLASLKSVQIHMGYQEKMNRTTYIFEIDGPRKGLLQVLMPAAPFTLSQLPPIPPDVAGVSVVQLDLAATYDLAKGITLQAAKLAAPDAAKEAEQQFQAINQFLGADLRQDVLAALGSKLSLYDSPSEGIFFQGMVLLLDVKDEAKLRAALQKVITQLGEAADVKAEVITNTYHGVQIHTVKAGTEGFFVQPSFTFHKGWLAISLYPQPLKGLVLRGQGKLPGWQPTERAVNLVNRETQGGAKLIGFAEADPRPTIRSLLALAPMVSGFVANMTNVGLNSFLIPNAQAVTHPLFPNVFLTLEENGRVRFESYSSINIPSILNSEMLPQWTMVSMAAMAFLGTRAQANFRQVGPAIPVAPAVPNANPAPLPAKAPEIKLPPAGPMSTAPQNKPPANPGTGPKATSTKPVSPPRDK